MLRSKKDVDRHVEQLEAKIHNENERNLKAFTIAKLYYNVGDYETAKLYLAKYISVRENSSMAFKLNGQVCEALQQRERALVSFKKCYELDPSQKDILLKIAEIITEGGAEDKGKARYWLEEAERHFPRHKNVTKLRGIVGGTPVKGSVDDLDRTNGNGAMGSNDTSPEYGNGNNGGANNSVLWSAGGILNGRRNPISTLNTPERSSTPLNILNASLTTNNGTPNSSRRFAPRASPERLAARVQTVESTQEKIVDLLLDQNKQVLEELKLNRQAVVEELKTHRQNVSELKLEMKHGLHELKLEVSKLGHALKEPSRDEGASLRELREIRDALSSLPKQLANALPPPLPPQVITQQVPTPAPAPAQQEPATGPGGRQLLMHDLQEALAQQTALLQLSGLSFASGMFGRPPAPGHPGAPPQGVLPPPHGAVNLPQVPHPHIPPPQQQQPTNNPTIYRPQPNLNQPEWVPPVADPNTNASPHGYQINLHKSPNPVSSPFPATDGPAVPITTNALLSNIPKPQFSSLENTIASTKASTVTATSPAKPAVVAKPAESVKPAAGAGGWGDKFKPKVGSWECAGCMMRNEASIIQCPACQTAQPGHEEEVKKKEEAAKPKITFGAAGGFKFGGATTTAPAPVAGSGFKFGVTSTTTTTEVKAAKDGHLSFEGQALKLNTAADAEEVANTIKNTTGIRELTFAGNTVGIEAAGAIGKALEGHPELERAHWKDMFTGRMKTEIPPALKHLSKGMMTAGAKLVELDLSDNAFGPIGTEGIQDLLRSPVCYTLKELKLNNTGCGVTGGKLLAKLLHECYDNSKKAGGPVFGLKVFILGRSRQENEGAKALAGVFKQMGTLEEVIMPQNGIYHEGIAALTDAFAKNPNLRILNMNDNTFTPQGARSLAAVLPKLQKLETLNLGDCLLKTEGASVICDALTPGHRELKHLHLDSNEIRIDAAQCLVDAIANKTKLETFTIDTNQFGEDGCETILGMLETIGKRDLIGDEIEDDEGPDSDEEDEDYEEDDDDDDEEDESEEEGEDTPRYSPEKSSSNIFGGATSSSNTSATTSIFGKVSTPAPGSLFGGLNSSNTNTTDGASTSIFGTPKTATTGGIFGGGSGAKTSLFGTPTSAAGATSSGFSFGKPAESTPTSSSAGGLDLSANKNLPSFGSVAGNTDSASGFSFGKTGDSSFKFAGTGSTLFGGQAGSSPQKDDGTEPSAEDPDHDPHFEPIIPLPELVKVTTGEEDEEVLFKHRGKVYRFDPNVKQWKERGIGDMKILKHPQRNTFRILLRREQIHKIACNHLITKEMELKPMYGSESAVTWFAMDHADEEPKMENLALKFKLIETKNEFQKIFEECQSQIGSSASNTPVKAEEKKPEKEKSPEKKDVQEPKAEEEKAVETKPAAPASIFGSIAKAAASPLFGATTPTSTTESPASSTSIFGTPKSTASTSIFGGASTNTASPSIFGGASTSATPGTGFSFGSSKPATEEGKDLSANKGLASFGSLAATSPSEGSGFSFGQTSGDSSFKFAGTGSTLFGGAAKTSPKKDGENADETVEDNEHDPHFEPIIPLPELVKVTTGEEDEEVLFKHRGKVYRYDPDTKQWKERGVGDMKILKHPSRNTFRVLLRREQIHKVACNHLITKEMEMKPMYGSETAVCWFAMDYAEDEPKMEHLACRFKHVETKDEFQKIFEQCQKDLDNPATANVSEVVADNAEGDEDYDEDEDEANTMFEMECELAERRKDGSTVAFGAVFLQVVYDDDVFGARIMATPMAANNEDDEEQVCNHLIAMQTMLQEEDGSETMFTWSALDFSSDPPSYRTFEVTFASGDDASMFKDTFNEGKELAEQSEILELPNQLDNPQDYYYAEGGDYEGES